MTRSNGPDPIDASVVSGAAWEAVVESLRASSGLVLGAGVPDDPRARAAGFRYLTRLFAAGLVTCVEFADPDYPEFGRMIEPSMKWGLDCPDCLYLYAPVRGDAEYRVWGSRGSANHLDLQVNFGHFALGDVSQWGTVSSISGMELETDADGSFELRLGGAERAGKHLRLAANAEFVLVRQYFDDWERERPADLQIERAGAPYPAPPLRTDQLAARFERLRMWMERGGALWEMMSRQALELPENSLTVFPPGAAGERAGLRGQAYGIGNYRCAPGDAVIVEFEVPECRHWNVALADWYWQSFDYATRQTSLNGHQSAIDGDGVFRGVIAHEDPGVPNWLDASGEERGTITVRFLLAERAPAPRLRAVPLAELRAHLPGATPHIDAAARTQVIEARRHAVLRRYRR